MGSLNPFKPPKIPAPPPLEPAPVAVDAANSGLTEDRLRRSRSRGSASNIVSSLSNQQADINVGTQISKLLGG